MPWPCSLSQYSDENMMDPYNLAICFGPTLMPIPDGQDPVACQAHVNEVIKTIIIHSEVIFPSQRELDGPVYEKCMTGGEEYWWVYQLSHTYFNREICNISNLLVVNKQNICCAYIHLFFFLFSFLLASYFKKYFSIQLDFIKGYNKSYASAYTFFGPDLNHIRKKI